jgi:N-acetylglucosaminyldiphosphoundecaprenol N-acetyl-beta-D-mannosaminyltransferase
MLDAGCWMRNTKYESSDYRYRIYELRDLLMMQKKEPSSAANIFGVRVDGVSEDAAVATVLDWWKQSARQCRIIFTPNVEQVMAAQEDSVFKDLINKGDLNVCDGTGLVWAERRMVKRNKRKPQLTERVAGIDLAQRLCAEAVKHNKNVLLIGGAMGMAEKAAKSLSKRFGNLNIVGIDGPSDASCEGDDEVKLWRQVVMERKPALVLVAFGAPKQEAWVMRHREWLGEHRVKSAMVVGGAVDVWAGKIVRAPLSWRKNGMEWLWRLVHQPWRWRRQMELVKFVIKVSASV